MYCRFEFSYLNAHVKNTFLHKYSHMNKCVYTQKYIDIMHNIVKFNFHLIKADIFTKQYKS